MSQLRADETGKAIARIVAKDYPASLCICASREHGGFVMITSQDKGNNLLDAALKEQIVKALRENTMLRQELSQLVVDAYSKL